MADYLPQANGNWSTTTWITAFSNLTAFAGGNTPPASIDDVYTDGKSITIDTNIFVNSLRTTTSPRTGGLAGGGYFINNGVSLTALSIIVGTTTCLTFLSASPNSCNIVGNITGATAGNTILGLNNSSTGTVTISGNHVAGSGAATTRPYAIQNASTGTINAIGSIRGGSSLDNPYGLHNASTGTVNITGSVFGNNVGGVNPYGVNNNSSGTINVIGLVIAGDTGNATGINNPASGVVNVIGGVRSGGGTTSGSQGITNSSGGRVTIVGDVSGGSSITQNVNAGVLNSGTGVVNITGNVIAGQLVNGGNLGAANSSSVGVINIVGNVFGGSGGFAIGFTNSSSGSVFISGNVIGGSGGAGLTNTSSGSVFINGSVIGGIGGVGANNSSTGLLSATRAIGNGFGLGSAGIGAIQVGLANSQNGRAYVEQVEFGPRGATPISGPVYILPSNRNTLVGYTTALGTPVTFYNSLSVDGLLPPVSSVQAGVIYNVGNSVGTMAVPSASAVQFGVPVDNTVGTAALQPQDVWGYARLSATQVDSMGDRLRNTATTQSIGYQIASFNL